MNHYYSEDELSFVNSLIQKKNIKECYNKAYFLQNNGCDLFSLFWNIYIDFYAYINPKLEAFIMKKNIAWNINNNNIHIIYVIKNLFISKSSSYVYNIRNYIINGGLVKHIYKIKNKKNIYTNLIISIKLKHFENVAYELVKLINLSCDINHIFNIIINYFTKYYGGSDRDKINEKWKNRPNIKKYLLPYYLLSIIIHLYQNESNITQTSTFVVPRKEEIDFYSNLSS